MPLNRPIQLIGKATAGGGQHLLTFSGSFGQLTIAVTQAEFDTFADTVGKVEPAGGKAGPVTTKHFTGTTYDLAITPQPKPVTVVPQAKPVPVPPVSPTPPTGEPGTKVQQPPAAQEQPNGK